MSGLYTLLDFTGFSPEQNHDAQAPWENTNEIANTWFSWKLVVKISQLVENLVEIFVIRELVAALLSS